MICAFFSCHAVELTAISLGCPFEIIFFPSMVYKNPQQNIFDSGVVVAVQIYIVETLCIQHYAKNFYSYF